VRETYPHRCWMGVLWPQLMSSMVTASTEAMACRSEGLAVQRPMKMACTRSCSRPLRSTSSSKRISCSRHNSSIDLDMRSVARVVGPGRTEGVIVERHAICWIALAVFWPISRPSIATVERFVRAFQTLQPLVDAFQLIENQRVHIQRVHTNRAVGRSNLIDDRLEFFFRFHGETFVGRSFPLGCTWNRAKLARPRL